VVVDLRQFFFGQGDWRRPSGGFWDPRPGRVKTMFWRKRKQSDFTAEIEAHLELETEQLLTFA
jgi:hypothetical protein